MKHPRSGVQKWNGPVVTSPMGVFFLMGAMEASIVYSPQMFLKSNTLALQQNEIITWDVCFRTFYQIT